MGPTSLRLRLVVVLVITAVSLTSLTGAFTLLTTRHLTLAQQERADLRQAYANAALFRATLAANPLGIAAATNALQQTANSQVFVRVDGEWQVPRPQAALTFVPASAISAVDLDHVVTGVLNVAGQARYLVGVPIPAVSAQMYEVFNLGATSATLETLLWFVVLGTLATALLGSLIAAWVTRRTTAPLVAAAAAAHEVAAGDLTIRVTTRGGGAEVESLVEAINTMVDQLSQRIERDARFASDVSHELRSPLTSLVTAVTVLDAQREELPPDAAQSLRVLSTNVRIFQRLVEDLLEISRADAGALDLTIENLSAATLTRYAVTSVLRRLGDSDVELVLDPRDPRVLVDRRRFERVMTNLFENAQRYAGGVVRVSVVDRDDAVDILVDDAGPGVDEDEREAIFERFHRGRAAHDRAGVTGSGIGLALVREHLRAMGGEVWVESSPDAGSRFVVRLARGENP
ncbi:MAG: HAMP domain-containing histidine kinase [Acidimicrobiaceae bacterium]|nr:HAMP domain-containing histidine kinase [Acidimicrobiaceae bacterium]